MEFASRAAVFFDNAGRYKREHATALMLQRSMLPTGLSAPSSVEVKHRYLPGSQLVEVGGDWYESIKLPGARVALVIGNSDYKHTPRLDDELKREVEGHLQGSPAGSRWIGRLVTVPRVATPTSTRAESHQRSRPRSPVASASQLPITMPTTVATSAAGARMSGSPNRRTGDPRRHGWATSATAATGSSRIHLAPCRWGLST